MAKSTTIGLTIFPPKSGMSVWSNGAHQNIFYLWMCFRAAGFRVLMINGGDGEPPAPQSLPSELREVVFVRTADIIDDIDLLIQAGAQVEAEHVERVHRRGGKAIAYKFGHDLAIDAERAIHGKPAGGIFNGARFDEVWTTAQHEHTCGSYWETTYRAPVRVLPHVWEPCFVDHMTAAFPPGLSAGYQPGRARKRVVVLEPNINLIKTCHVPLVIAERAYRARPELFDKVLVSNAIHLREHLAFATFAKSLDIAHARAEDGQPVVSFEGRYNTPWFLAAHGDVVVSHQWVDTPTYLHYDVLHLGYPLVHNVTGMPGYHYSGFDARRGGAALVEAMTEDGRDWNRQQRRDEVTSFLSRRRATAPANVNAHARAVEEVLT
jgi:hypothetical protein